MSVNRRIVLAARPDGFPVETDFELVESEVAEIEEGEFLVQAIYLSVDPYMRGRISEAKSYADPVEIGATMVGESVDALFNLGTRSFLKGRSWLACLVGRSLPSVMARAFERSELTWLRFPRLCTFWECRG